MILKMYTEIIQFQTIETKLPKSYKFWTLIYLKNITQLYNLLFLQIP